VKEGKDKLLRVGEVARAAGKTVRAIHLYEELGLLSPASRSSGGFRLYHADAVERIGWITKLQAIGFSLSEIQGFVRDFESADSGRSAAFQVRETFRAKLEEVRQQITQLQVIENDLVEAIEYLESCQDCSPVFTQDECHVCDHQGHEAGQVPNLFYPLATVAAYDVNVAKLKREDEPH
jgi:MerR family transcriptional regulator, copper efflux regulator